uniref:Uncharacterized protein n=1 Tax=Arundo donax TaxID=35708 RepID=A0A0A9H197_ARUDO
MYLQGRFRSSGIRQSQSVEARKPGIKPGRNPIEEEFV